MQTAPVLLLSLFALFAPPVGAVVANLEIVTPRAFGYVIGDVIQHTIQIELDSGYHLERDSLPKASRLNRWLELRAPRLSSNEESGAARYEIVLVYQILNSPERLQEIFTPNFTLTASDGERYLPVLVPTWGFTIAPITKIRATTNVAFLDIKPERPPPDVSVTPYVIGLVGTGLAILLGLFFLAYAYGDIPFLKRAQGPFALAYRRLKNLENKQHDPLRYRDALRCMHHALNQTAGSVLFVDELDTFFSNHPSFVQEREAIADLFVRSRAAFFQAGKHEDVQPQAIDWILHFCRRCRDLERGLA